LKPLLLKHKCVLSITDEVRECGGIVYIEATASITCAEGGRNVSAQAGINPDRKGMDISQSFGSSSSYARKYALNGLFLIDDTKDADTKDNSKEPSKKTKEEPKDTRSVMRQNTMTFDKACTFLKGGGDFALIQKKYIISKEVETALYSN